MEKFDNVELKDIKGKPVRIEENQIAKLAIMRQMSWYILTLAIYIICSLIGFGVAYFVVHLLIEMKFT